MRWEDERYVRWYTRNTPEWNVLPWQARGLFGLILRELDRAGILDLGRLGLKAVAVQIRADWDDVEKPLKKLLDDGMLIYREDVQLLAAPNFIEAQECHQSDRARQRAARERARDHARALSHGVTPTSQVVTVANGIVTESHGESHDVTGCHSEPCLAVPSLAELSDPEAPLTPDEEARVRLVSKSDRPPPARKESGYDLAKRVWSVHWSKKYGKSYIFAADNGRGSEDYFLQRLGRLANESAGDGAEEWTTRVVKSFLRDPGGRNWLVENQHPLRALERDLNKHSGSVQKKPAPAQSEATTIVPLSVEEQATRAARLSSMVRGIGAGGGK